MSDLYIPLDPRPDATEITPIELLRSAEIGVTVPSFSVKEIKSMAVDPKTYIIGEIDYTNPRIAANFVVGDMMVKVNDTIPTTFVHLSKLLASSGDITILIRRRAFVTPPGHVRVQAAMTALKLSVQKKMSYMVVTCKKMPYDIFLSTSFGFTAENVNVTKSIKKFVVAEINGNTAAEKYFSVGDNLIDFRGLPVENDGKVLKQFNMTFQTVGEIDVLIERPITVKHREATAGLIKGHLLKHDTPAMCDEVTKIGLLAARYHDKFWKRLVPVSITQKPGSAPKGDKSPVAAIPDVCTAKNATPEKKPLSKEGKTNLSKEGKTRGSAETRSKTEKDDGMRKKSKHSKESKKSKAQKKTAKGKKSQKRNKKNNSTTQDRSKDYSEETRDVSVDATTMDQESTVDKDGRKNRVKIVGAKSFQEITSDVDPATELESVGLRYTDDFEDENTQDDEDQKKMKRARAALRPIKKGLFSTMALFKKQEKEKEK